MRWLDRHEIVRFRQNCPVNWWPLFGLLLSTGITISEALGLRRADIDLQTGRLSIHEGFGRKLKRRSRARELYVDPSFRTTLADWIRTNDIGSPDTRVFAFTYWPARAAWKAVCKLAGIEGARIHDARHTYAVHAVANGVPEARLQKLLGHAHAGTTRRYAMHSPEAFRERDAGTVTASMGLDRVSLTLQKQA
jgi:integrase